MTQFEQYRWEDRVLRKGSWKVNLAVGAVAFGVLTGACLDSGSRSWAAAFGWPLSHGTSITELELQRRQVPTAMHGVIPEYLDEAVGSHWLMSAPRLAI